MKCNSAPAVGTADHRLLLRGPWQTASWRLGPEEGQGRRKGAQRRASYQESVAGTRGGVCMPQESPGRN